MQIATLLRRITLFLFSLVFSTGMMLAQERTITGTVSATDEGPLPGVNVTVKGTTTGVMTDISGRYSISVPGPKATLVFSSIGYVSQELIVGNQSTISIVLVTDVQALQEVVVTGYTTQRRRDLTGAVGVVNAEELTAVPTGQLTSQLQGRASGVTVIGDGRPGQAAKVRIRGLSSFESNDPLYIVDGVPTTDISFLNPNDIENMVVLKDAGAASIYGSRASNGVIVVNTKKGSSGGIKVTYDMYTGWSLPGAGPTKDLLTSEEFAQLQWLVYKNDGTVENHPVFGPSSNPNPTMPQWWISNGSKDTDWWDEVTDPALKTSHDITLSGGTQNSRYFAGLNYLDEDGIVIHNYSKRARGRFNSEFTFLGDRVKIGENLTMQYYRGRGVGNLGEGSPINGTSYRMVALIPVIWTGPDYVGNNGNLFKAGGWGGTGIASRIGNNTNRVADLTRGKDDWDQNFNLLGNVFVDIKILKGLNFRSSFGGGFGTGYGQSFGFKTPENAEPTNNTTFNEYANWGANWIWTNQLTFDKTFGYHKVTALAGYEAIKTGIGRSISGQRGNYFSTDISFRTLSNGASINSLNGDLWTPVALVSLIGKVDYGYRNKYMLSATFRRDGSSKFGPGTRYGIFPAFSAAWRISEESFMEGLSWLSDLKLRGSWGTMGNQLALSSQNQFNLYSSSVRWSGYDITGAFTSAVTGYRPSRIGNPDAKWETNVTTDIGIESTLLNDRITFVFDWFLKQTKDLLFSVERPAQGGNATAPYINVAEMQNKGFDVELGYRDNFGDLGFRTNLNLTHYKNKIVSIAEGYDYFDYGGGTTRIGASHRNIVGEEMSSFFGYKYLGLFKSAGEVDAHADQTGAAPGFLKFEDVNGDGTITPEDRVIIGSPHPDFTYGLNLDLSYKGFDLNAYFYGSQGNEIFNWNLWWIDYWASFQGQKSKRLLYESWTPERPDATVPKASNTANFSTSGQVNGYYIEDGSFLKLKTLQLGYTLPQSVVSKIKMKSLRVYVQTVNLFTLTKYSGMDPELGGDDRAFGSDTGNYPNVKQVILGLNITL